MNRFRVVKRDDWEDISNAVSQLLDDGWKLHGEMHTQVLHSDKVVNGGHNNGKVIGKSSIVYIQALVRPTGTVTWNDLEDD